MEEKHIKALEMTIDILTKTEGMVMSGGNTDTILEALEQAKGLVDYAREAGDVVILAETDESTGEINT